MKTTKENSLKLYRTISRLICGLMAVIFLILIVSSVAMSQNAVSQATFNHLNAISKANGCQIQEYMNICQSTAQGLVSQIEEAFLEEKGLPPQDFELIAKETSEVYKNLKINSIKRSWKGT